MASNSIEEVLKKQGPMLTSELAKRLSQEFGLSPEAARKQVQRGCEGMLRLPYVVFPHRARFVYLKKDFGSPYFLHALLKSTRESNSAFFHGLTALMCRGGAMPVTHFLVACGSPIAQKGHISSMQLLERMEKSQLVRKVQVAGIGECVALASQLQSLNFDSFADLRARLIVEAITLRAVKDWVRKLGVVSYDSVKLRDDVEDLPKVGTFNWDLSGPSYLHALMNYSSRKANPGFFVCDIAMVSQVSDQDVSGFVRKCLTLRQLKKVGSCLQLFLASSFNKEAFALLKGHGIIPATPETLFGKDVAEGLSNLIQVLASTAMQVVDPEALNKIFQSLSKIEGAASTLRGCLFEFMISEIIKSILPKCTTQMNRIVKDALGRGAEIDVLAIAGNRAIYFIECKGYSPAGYLPDSEVDKWLNDRIPVIRQYAKTHLEWRDLEQHYELWSSAMLSEGALAKVSAENEKTDRYQINIYGPEHVLKTVEDNCEKSFADTYRQHFVNNPMREYEKEQKRKAAQLEKANRNKLLENGVLTPRMRISTSATSNENISQNFDFLFPRVELTPEDKA